VLLEGSLSVLTGLFQCSDSSFNGNTGEVCF